MSAARQALDLNASVHMDSDTEIEISRSGRGVIIGVPLNEVSIFIPDESTARRLADAALSVAAHFAGVRAKKAHRDTERGRGDGQV